MCSRNLVSRTTSLGLGDSLTSTEDLLVLVLLLLSLLSGRLLNLLLKTVSDESVGWLELLGVSDRVVDETETSGLTTTVLSSETEDRNSILVSLVDTSELLSQLILGDVGSVWVENVNDELESSQKWVVDDLSGSDGNSVRLCKIVSKLLKIR